MRPGNDTTVGLRRRIEDPHLEHAGDTMQRADLGAVDRHFAARGRAWAAAQAQDGLQREQDVVGQPVRVFAVERQRVAQLDPLAPHLEALHRA